MIKLGPGWLCHPNVPPGTTVFWTTETLDSPLIWSLVIQVAVLDVDVDGIEGAVRDRRAGQADGRRREGDPADDHDCGRAMGMAKKSRVRMGLLLQEVMQ